MTALPKPLLISVSGVDAAGKSTQIELLKSFLVNQGHDCISFWFRPGYSDEMTRIKVLLRRLRGLPQPGHSQARDQAFARSSVRASWVTMALFDAITQYAVKLRALLYSGTSVICDRYVDDAVLDFTLRFQEVQPHGQALRRLLRTVAPKPHCQVLYTLPWDVMQARMAQKHEPFPDDPHTMRRRFAAYEDLARGFTHQVIDAQPGISQVHEATCRLLQQSCSASS